MDRLKRAALITRLLQNLRDKGSWCGETHAQKAAFFAQHLMEVPLEFDFILYKHGPFSFDLRDELTSLRADGLIQLVPRWPYGPTIKPTDLAEKLQNNYTKTLKQHEKKIAFVADKLGAKGVADLERLATALYVTKQKRTDEQPEKRAKKLSELKPHIRIDQAQAAIDELDQIIKEAQEIIH
ncbi:hypothetical protein SAMN02745206_01414 [Desulfacinum infernum DSM 9756]|jgi:uncharacterized protein YwgA|uniref:Antitoxin SocA-like Panacea domain-containing protein n=1 Tax=Desulfacinum infernum DSM 9756 TaxID=1121391 RepID=A0A1M4Z696_9BACT|nr:hypothetical protein [Desulfacinum infernum]SHF13520.1 hypothetical protein SAMN02745206_01414 [Desulfacinum infernum DSM 9756]